MKFIAILLSVSSLFFLTESCNNLQANSPDASQSQDAYQCLPCGRDCDKPTYAKGGECRDCNMKLVKKSTVVHKSISPSEICEYIKNHPNAILLDVRSEDEFKGKRDPEYGRLKNAINIPVQLLERRLGTINDLKDKEVLVYCSHSHRSPRASYLLTQNGFTNVTNMDGGLSRVSDRDCREFVGK